MSDTFNNSGKREVRSFLMARDPSIDRRFRPRPAKKQRLFDEILETEENSDNYDTESETSLADDEATGSSVQTCEIESGPLVYLRLRPVDKPTNTYTISDCGNVLITGSTSDASSGTNKANMEKHYSFTTIFDSTVGQRDVFDMCVGHKIQDEESFTVLTYGTSGSGKTYTLLGDEVRAGIIPRALENIFTLYSQNIYHQPSMKLLNGRLLFLEDDAALRELQIQRRILSSCPDLELQYKRLQQIINEDHGFETKAQNDVSVVIWVSFVEIYNELVYDLLTLPHTTPHASIAEPPRKNLKIACSNGHVFIKGLTSIYVRDGLQALKLLRFGQQRLTYASTAINSNSSRSHCIFFVDILKFHRSGETTQTSYKFCDLAGSERLDKTGNVGSRLKEAQRINTSLMVLGRCLDAASNARKKTNDVIPFRESKLTMLLQESLLGKEKLAMIVTVTPLDKYYEENFNVLSFASIARNIVFKQAPLKHHSRYSSLITKLSYSEETLRLREYVERLEKENVELQLRIESMEYKHSIELQQLEETLRKELTANFQETLKSNKELHEQRMQSRLNIQRREFEALVDSLKRKHQEEIEDLQDEYENKSNSDIELIE